MVWGSGVRLVVSSRLLVSVILFSTHRLFVCSIPRLGQVGVMQMLTLFSLNFLQISQTRANSLF